VVASRVDVVYGQELRERGIVREREVAGRCVCPIGFGGAKLSLGVGRPTEVDALRTIHAALDAGVRLIDTSDVYCLGAGDVGHNERLFAKALSSWSGDTDGVVVASKCGQWWDGEGGVHFDGSAARIRAACEASLVALGVEKIDLYLLHRLPTQYGTETASGDGGVEASVLALEALRQEGKICHIGLSNVDAHELRGVPGTVALAAIENPGSPVSPPMADELEFCEENGVTFLAWGPLTGTFATKPFVLSTGDAGAVGRRLEALRAIAADRRISVQQATLSWELSASPRLIPLVGATRPETILDSLGAVNVELTAEELGSIVEGS
jgi:aryl-alcohol dehydrogenase-like predicted oxidoreductase